MLLLPAELTHVQAHTCLLRLRRQLQEHQDAALTLDASGLQQFDSAALAVLLDLLRSARQLGKTLRLQGVPQRLQRLAALYGIDSLLGG